VNQDLLVLGDWKYVRGGKTMIEAPESPESSESKDEHYLTGTYMQAAWGGPLYPNVSTATDPIDAHNLVCPERGCLFNVVADPTEREEVGASHPDILLKMKAKLPPPAHCPNFDNWLYCD